MVPSRPRAASSAPLGAPRVPRFERRGEFLEGASQATEDRVSGAADVEQRIRREHQRVQAEGDDAADQRLDRTRRKQPEGRRRRRADDDRRHARLGHQQRSTAHEHRRRHGQHHHQPDLRRAGPEQPHEQVRDQHPDHHAAHQFQRALALLSQRRAKTDHGGNRGEPGLPVRQQQLGQIPGDHGSACRLQDRPQLCSQPAPPSGHGRPQEHQGRSVRHATGESSVGPGGACAKSESQSRWTARRPPAAVHPW